MAPMMNMWNSCENLAIVWPLQQRKHAHLYKPNHLQRRVLTFRELVYQNSIWILDLLEVLKCRNFRTYLHTLFGLPFPTCSQKWKSCTVLDKRSATSNDAGGWLWIVTDLLSSHVIRQNHQKNNDSIPYIPNIFLIFLALEVVGHVLNPQLEVWGAKNIIMDKPQRKNKQYQDYRPLYPLIIYQSALSMGLRVTPLDTMPLEPSHSCFTGLHRNMGGKVPRMTISLQLSLGWSRIPMWMFYNFLLNTLECLGTFKYIQIVGSGYFGI